MSQNERNPNLSFSRQFLKAFSGIRDAIYGERPDESLSLDLKINNAISKMNHKIVNHNPYNYAETLKNAISDSLTSDNFDQNSIINNIMQSSESISRFLRYSNADEIVMSITQCARALKVISDSIISPDNVKKASLNVFIDGNETEDMNEQLNEIKNIVDELELEDGTYSTVSQTLKYGDNYVEICDYRSREVPITQSLYLSECITTNKEPLKEKTFPPTKYQITEKVHVINESTNEINIDNKIKNITISFITDESERFGLNENLVNLLESSYEDELHKKNKKKKKKEDDEENINLEDVRLIYHHPAKVIKIQSRRFPMNLGYLVMPLEASGGAGNVGYYPSPMSQGGGKGSSSRYGRSISPFNTELIGIDAIYLDLLKMIKKYINNNEIKVNKGEMKDLLVRAIRDLDDTDGENNLKVRYVPPERMEHFFIDNNMFFPYGEGMFEKVMLNAKMYIALKTAITIKRVSDSSEKRIIRIDTSMNRNAKNMIESFKSALSKRKFSVDSFANISSIPTMITTFEDWIIPTNKDRDYIKFDTLPPQFNIGDLSNELKFMRDEIISSLECPPSFVNIDENVGNKSLLSHESSNFASTILSYQKIFSKSYQKLVSKIYKFVHKEKLDQDIKISFPPPKFLQVERDREHVDMVAGIIDTLTNLNVGLNREYLKKQYLGIIDWEEADEFNIQQKIENRTKPVDVDNAPMTGGMGMPGGMGGGMDMGMGGTPMPAMGAPADMGMGMPQQPGMDNFVQPDQEDPNGAVSGMPWS